MVPHGNLYVYGAVKLKQEPRIVWDYPIISDCAVSEQDSVAAAPLILWVNAALSGCVFCFLLREALDAGAVIHILPTPCIWC